MKIGFLTTHLGLFGSIRELLEISNRLVAWHHDVTIYFDQVNFPVRHWMPINAKLSLNDNLPKMDALILMDSPFDYHMTEFRNCDSKFKTFVMMGFDHERFSLEDLKGNAVDRNLKEILMNYEVCADGQWQLDYFKELGICTGVPIGGINIQQFNNTNSKRNIDVGYSGDRRPRKGTGTILSALERITWKHDYYWTKGDQKFIVEFLNRTKIFVDNHLRAGWCNPVLEAMACGCAVICNDIPAVKDFAINNKTAFVLSDNSVRDFVDAINLLMNNDKLREYLSEQAQEKAKEFDYDIVARKFEEYLLSKL